MSLLQELKTRQPTESIGHYPIELAAGKTAYLVVRPVGLRNPKYFQRATNETRFTQHLEGTFSGKPKSKEKTGDVWVRDLQRLKTIYAETVLLGVTSEIDGEIITGGRDDYYKIIERLSDAEFADLMTFCSNEDNFETDPAEDEIEKKSLTT